MFIQATNALQKWIEREEKTPDDCCNFMLEIRGADYPIWCTEEEEHLAVLMLFPVTVQLSEKTLESLLVDLESDFDHCVQLHTPRAERVSASYCVRKSHLQEDLTTVARVAATLRDMLVAVGEKRTWNHDFLKRLRWGVAAHLNEISRTQ